MKENDESKKYQSMLELNIEFKIEIKWFQNMHNEYFG